MKKGIDHIGIGVCYFCHDGSGRVLLSKRGIKCRDEHGCWDAGGGGIEFGHSVEETLKKEIREEYCADIIEYEFLGYRDLFCEQNGVSTHWVMMDFGVLIDPETVQNGEPDKFEEIGWFHIDALPSPMHSAWDVFFQKNRNRIGL